MTIPFLDCLKKLTRRGGTAAAESEPPARPAARVIRPKKPEGERLSKTVMPNATRSLSTQPDVFRSAAATPTPRSVMPLELGAQKITASAPRQRPSQLPPALARALEPKIERTISLRVADLLEVVPAGFIKPVEILDANAIVSLKASEIEKGMPDKHPTISLPSLYQQVPEIFLRSIRPDDVARVELPYEKVLAQFQSAHVRTDQVRDPAVPHVDTPILTATIEDSRRFGTKVEPIETSALPTVPVKHATAKSIADAVPDATPAQTQPPMKSTSSGQRIISLHSPEVKPKSETPEPPISGMELKIPFDLSPNGTGVSASERVPASTGPPVPTFLPSTNEPPKLSLKLSVEEAQTPTPAKEAKIETPATPSVKTATKESEAQVSTTKPNADPIAIVSVKPATEKSATLAPLKIKVGEMTKPASEVKPVAKETVTAPTVKPKTGETPKLTPPAKTIAGPSNPMLPVVSEPKEAAPTISFLLKAVLQNLPAFQLHGDASAIPDDARITFPLALIEPQLAGGRVSVAPDVFQTALPVEYRRLFQVDVAKTSVALPLEEVLKNLPATVLKLRDDQEHIAFDKDFDTPFLAKAQEDALRFAPKAEATREVVEESTHRKAAEATKAKVAIEKIDPKEIVSQANALAGVKACAITFSDGLSLAGDLPEKFEANGLCAMAPSMLKRVAQHVHETKLGQLVAMTLYASDAAVSFFARGNVCLTALHDSSLAPEVRTRLTEFAEKLSHTYTQSESPNVDH
jgi:predicted regulator of Ras-like GTPase activity (Roadblock/LC7/MglB family)